MQQAEKKFLIHPKPSAQHWAVVFYMFTCYVLAWWLTPHTTWFENIGNPQFEKLIPKQFGDWNLVESGLSNNIVNPEQQEAINSVYSQVVSRVYEEKSTGRRLILSVAYGDNQTYSKQLHRPEACYSTAGFKITDYREEIIKVIGKQINMNRMTATAGPRVEYVTYWIRIGDKVISGPPLSLNYARMSMGLKGYIADGLLFRVSEVSNDQKGSYDLQAKFIDDLLRSLSPVGQNVLIGSSDV
jgi:EpsI family protein